jgi:Rrf2 family transcriptional regulator, cysteine metabolism repressor
MKVSKKGEQALKALMELALVHPGKPSTLKSLSDATGTSIKFLEQILLLLRRGGFVKSLRGSRGGFVLIKDPREITIGEVIRFLEGPLGPLGNRQELHELIENSERFSGLYQTLLDVRNSASTILDNRTLWDVCQLSQEIRQAASSMYYI